MGEPERRSTKTVGGVEGAMTQHSEPQTIVDCKEAAESAGLSYASKEASGLTRRRVGTGFSYRGLDGCRLKDRAALHRIRALSIPPVWICSYPNGHIQAVGYDEKGRKQYRYHITFREIRDGVKFEHMMLFAEAPPRLRCRVATDVAAPGLGRNKGLATVVRLLETATIRVGNEAYARENKSYGLTTPLACHAKIDGAELRFQFKGKSGKTWRLSVRDRRIVKTCQELPGQHLFQYLDDAGERRAVTSTDVNSHLRETSGIDIAAKDFRTWTGTVLAAMALSEFETADSAARAKRNVTHAIERVSAKLGNTPTIC